MPATPQEAGRDPPPWLADLWRLIDRCDILIEQKERTVAKKETSEQKETPEKKDTPEARWMAGASPGDLLACLGEGASERKLRLFACACCRHVCSAAQGSPEWRRQIGRDRQAIEVNQRYADALIGAEKVAALREVLLLAYADLPSLQTSPSYAAYLGLGDPSLPYRESCRLAAHCAGVWIAHFTREQPHGVERRQADLLREIYGPLPFRGGEVVGSWLTWHDGAIKKLAESVYARGTRFQGALCAASLAMLADSLEEAGCTNAEILEHLRGPQHHVSGCWVVDLLTGRS